MTTFANFPVLHVALSVLAGASLSAQALVSPADRTALEGNASTIYPLGRAHTRLQQMLGDLPTTPRSLLGHAYRRDAVTVRGAVAPFRSQVSVIGSISPRTAAAPSATFADNHGTTQLLLDQAWISFPQTDRPTVDPAATFELRLPWATPFSWPGQGVLCLETVVHSNDVGGLPDRNFSVFQDGHDLSTSSSRQPGFRYGSGCAFEGTTTRSTATFELVRTASSLDLELALRAGARSNPSPAFATLMFGVTATNWTWPTRPDCTVYLNPLATAVVGQTDATGNLDVTLRNLGQATGGRTLFAQVLTVQPATGLGTFSDVSRLTIPHLPPAQLMVSRIANGDDAAALTGTVSFSVPVTEIF